MERETMKNIILTILIFSGLNAFSQDVRDSICQINFVKIDEPTFFSAIDTLVKTERENGIENASDCFISVGVVGVVGVHQAGLIQMTSTKSKLERLYLWPYEVNNHLWGTYYKNHLVLIRYFGKEELPNWIHRTSDEPLEIPCNGGTELTDADKEELCVGLYARYLHGRIEVLRKKVATRDALME